MRNGKKMMELLEQGPVTAAVAVSGPWAGESMLYQNRNGKNRLAVETSDRLKVFWEKTGELLDQSTFPVQLEIDGTKVFAERLIQEPELVILGGGHVSLELAGLAHYLEYPYTVIDDREEFASRERFPEAKECICRPFSQVLEERSFSPNAYYVIVTRGHAHDLECLERILKRPCGYVGMIGSRGKVKKVMDALREQGYSQEKLDTVHAPIGLPIGGETPKEIGISIIAQLVQVKNKEQPGSYVDAGMKAALSEGRPGVMATIIEKKGSAPRGVGSRMLVGADGIICGTIGGGMVEYQAEEDARKLLGSGRCLTRHYRLDNQSAASLGMWCGGEVEVLFEA
ncbi:MAG: XdhC family protein [Lachnospiraceae bacterium]